MNENVNVESKNNDSKGIAITLFGIFTIIAAIAGATFAYFQTTLTANVSGSSAYVANPLTLTVSDLTQTSVGDTSLIPLLDNEVQNAVTSANGACLNEDGSPLCKLFSITVRNVTTTNFYVEGTLNFAVTPSGSTMPNLKWAKSTSSNSGFPNSTSGPFYSSFNTFTTNTSSTTQTNILTNTTLVNANDSLTFYVVVWVSETNASQTDNGTFTGTVTFNGYSATDKSLTGVTSTIIQ